MKSGICNLSGNIPLMASIVNDLQRFHGARPVNLSFSRNTINNITVNDPTDPVPDDVTIIAPVPYGTKTPSDCVMELMLALHRLRVLGAISFHIVFIVTPFDGSGSRTSPTTPGFKILANCLNSTSDIRKITMFGPHSSQIEDMINVPRKIVSHRELLNLGELFDDQPDTTFISPDIGGYYNTTHVSSGLTNTPVLSIAPGIILPDLPFANVVIFDDMIVTGTKILGAYEAVKALGPSKITIAITHVMHEEGVKVLRELLEDPTVHIVIADTLLTLEHERCTIRSITEHVIRCYWGERDINS